MMNRNREPDRVSGGERERSEGRRKRIQNWQELMVVKRKAKEKAETEQSRERGARSRTKVKREPEPEWREEVG